MTSKDRKTERQKGEKRYEDKMTKRQKEIKIFRYIELKDLDNLTTPNELLG